MESMTLQELHDWHIGQQNLYRAKIRAGGVVPSKRNWSLLADFHGAAANAINYRDCPTTTKLEASAGIPEWMNRTPFKEFLGESPDWPKVLACDIWLYQEPCLSAIESLILKHAPNSSYEIAWQRVAGNKDKQIAYLRQVIHGLWPIPGVLYSKSEVDQKLDQGMGSALR